MRPESEGGQWGEGVRVAAVTTLSILTEVGEARMFRDRIDAGKRLGARLGALRGHDVVVVGLPRGGVPVAAEVARALEAPLDVIVVRKLGVPWQPELAMGAVGEDGVLVVDENTVRQVGVTDEELATAEARERGEVERRGRLFRGERPRTNLRGRTVVVVDDGIATGSTARAACRVARAHGAARVVLAVPVAPHGWTATLRGAADELVALETPRRFLAVGQWYDDFSQTSDDEVSEILSQESATRPRREANGLELEVRVGAAALPGHLSLPPGARGLVVFSHGSGSSRHSPRNRYVADVLVRAGFGTLLFDLLRADEEPDRSRVFDIPLLAGRLADATRWLRALPETAHLTVGYFGASTGAAAALSAATEPDLDIGAVVSRGGRPDLAADWLSAVRAPTLLIVGGADPVVHRLNQEALTHLQAPSRLAVVPGATHLFTEPGALEQVARLASDWFLHHLTRHGASAR